MQEAYKTFVRDGLTVALTKLPKSEMNKTEKITVTTVEIPQTPKSFENLELTNTPVQLKTDEIKPNSRT